MSRHNNGSDNGYVARIDKEGNKIWVNLYAPTNSSESLFDFQKTDSNVISLFSNNNGSYSLISYDINNGEKKWETLNISGRITDLQIFENEVFLLDWSGKDKSRISKFSLNNGEFISTHDIENYYSKFSIGDNGLLLVGYKNALLLDLNDLTKELSSKSFEGDVLFRTFEDPQLQSSTINGNPVIGGVGSDKYTTFYTSKKTMNMKLGLLLITT